MARFSNDPFPGTDYSQYMNWEKVTLPTGEVFYTVPGYPGYVFDPVASNATGRKVFRRNPKMEIDAAGEQQRKQQEQEDLQKGLIKQQQFNQSPLGQLVPVAGSVGGMVAASQFMNKGSSALELAQAELLKQQLAGNATAPAAQAAAQGATQGAGSVAQGTAFGPGGSASGVGAELAPGTPQTPDILSASALPGPGMPIEQGFTLGNVVSAAAALKGSYDTYNSLQNGGAGLRGSMATAGGGIGGLVAGPVGAGIGTVAGNALGYGLQDNKRNNNLALAALGPVGWGLMGARALGFNPIHKTTRQYATANTDDLLTAAAGDEAALGYVHAMRDQYEAPPPDPSRPFFGKYGSFDEYKDAGLDATNLSGVYGNLSVYGPKEWAALTDEQRRAVTQKNIDSDLYYSSKGDVKISDEEIARRNLQDVLGMQAPGGTDVFTQAASKGSAGAGNRLPGAR